MHKGRGPNNKGFKGKKPQRDQDKKPMDKEALQDQLDKELAIHNAKIGGNTEIYAKKQHDKMNEELTKLREEKQENEKPTRC